MSCGACRRGGCVDGCRGYEPSSPTSRRPPPKKPQLKKRCPKFPTLPLVGKVGDKKPLPTFQSRVDEAGNVEVYV